ncbi:transposase family protein [Cuspidothrix issatschenkoi]|uniref:transposase family protein n=1 Tax=Cuspidothrix issatschenkoi TaxID=230752 RepID=UPI0010571BB5|nr:transposase family protein [Cuspidothrix issatschenkoi]
MKNIIHYIHLHPKRARGILGISYDQFISLMEQALLAHQEQKGQLEKGKLRVNSPGGGRKPKLTIEEEICLTLFYLRQMPTFEVLGLH